MRQTQHFEAVITCSLIVSLVGMYLIYLSIYIDGQIQIDQIDLLVAALFVLDTGLIVMVASALKPMRGLLIHSYIRWALILPGVFALIYFTWQREDSWLVLFLFPLLYPAILDYDLN